MKGVIPISISEILIPLENADKAVTVGFDPDSLEWDQYMGSAVSRTVTK